MNSGSRSINWTKRSHQKPTDRSINWTKRARSGFARHMLAPAVLLLMAVSVMPAQAFLRAQPDLLALAAQSPAQRVSVIIQKTTTSSAPEELVARTGGQLTKDLRIINAFAAEMDAGDLPALAASADVRWISLDAPVARTAGPDGAPVVESLVNAYDHAIRADALWAEGYQGSSVTVAVLDSGISGHADYDGRVDAWVKFNNSAGGAGDAYGHGTHIAGIIAGNGASLAGAYVGVGPKARLISVKVTDDGGTGSTSDAVAGMQWIFDNRARYNIRVVNVSLNSSLAQSYHFDPLSAAAEILWFNGIVVVASAGNNGSGSLYPPANDPFVITVGATDDRGTFGIGDDEVPSFSAYGVTSDGVAKPDLVAPGKNIVSTSAGSNSRLAKAHPDHIVNRQYFRMSGTSMSAAVTAGAVALLLQDEPGLNPDQVKFRLMATANRTWGRYDAQKAGAGMLDAYAAVKGTTIDAANNGMPISNLLNTGLSPASSVWGSVNWSSVNWSSVNWSSVNWSSVNWSSVNWSSVNWSSDYWGN